MMKKIRVFDNYKNQKKLDEAEQVLDYLSKAKDAELEILHQRAEALAGHELTILNHLRDKWKLALKAFREFSYDKALTSTSSDWTEEMLTELGKTANSYVIEAKKAKDLYIDKLKEHLSLLDIDDKFKK